MKFLLLSLLYIFGLTWAFYLFAFYVKLDILHLTSNEFLFTFFGVLLGFSLTIFTFIVGMVEKIKEKAEVKFNNDETKIGRVQTHIDSLYCEIKDDIWFSFFSLVLIAIIYLIGSLPIEINIGNFVWDQDLFIACFKLSLFVLNLYAIYDLIITSFKLSDTVSVLKTGEN